MKKRYKFVAKGKQWNDFLDDFSQAVESDPELNHIYWEAEFTGGIGTLIIDYGGDIDVVIDHKLADGHWLRW